MCSACSDSGSVYFYRFAPFRAGAAKLIFIVLLLKEERQTSLDVAQ